MQEFPNQPDALQADCGLENQAVTQHNVEFCRGPIRKFSGGTSRRVNLRHPPYLTSTTLSGLLKRCVAPLNCGPGVPVHIPPLPHLSSSPCSSSTTLGPPFSLYALPDGAWFSGGAWLLGATP